MNFYNPWGLLGLMSIPVILLMYILKQKYEEIEVPSLFLWMETLNNQEAYRPWEKLKKNILMFIQLIIACLIILGLTKPYLTGQGKKVGNYVLVLDQSMSMQAVDETPNRFAVAKDKLNQLIRSFEPNAKVSVIIMGKEPYILTNQSTDKNFIIRKLKEVKVSNGEANYESTALLIDSLYKQSKAKIYFFTDHKASIGDFNIEYVKVGKPSENCGIILVSHSKEEEQTAVLVKVKNFGVSTKKLPVTLYGDNQLIDIQNIELSPGTEKNLFFTGLSRDVGLLKAKIDSKDALTIDDTMYDVINEDVREKVLLVTQQNVFLEQILSMLPQVELYKGDPKEINTMKGYYLYIFDGEIPKALPEDGHILVFNPPKDNPLIEVEDEIEISQIQSSPGKLLEFIQQMDFDIAKSKKISVPDWGKEIIGSKETPLVVAGEQNKRKILVCGFDLHQTDLPLKKEFPIFMYNIMQWFIPERVHNLDKIGVGDTIEFEISPHANEVNVVDPQGNIEKIAPPFPIEPYQNTNEVGIYTLEEKGNENSTFHSFAVNPPVELESNLNLFENDGNGMGQDLEHETDIVKGHRSLVNIVLILVLVFVGIEWWVYTGGI